MTGEVIDAVSRTPARPSPGPAGDGGPVVIALSGVHKRFNGTEVLSGLDLEIQAHQTLVIIGRSGSGKSVTLKHIVGLLAPDQGTVRVFGKDLSKVTRKELIQIRLKIGYLFQSGALINWLRIDENVALPLRTHMRNLTEEEIMRRVREKLEMVEMVEAAAKYPSEISGGMKKRAGLARAIILDPEVILYDEPTAGLDPVMASSINEMVIKTRENMAVSQVVVTHDMESAFRIADRIAMLYEGRIIASGTPEEIRASKDPVVHQFITGSSEGPIGRS